MTTKTKIKPKLKKKLIVVAKNKTVPKKKKAVIVDAPDLFETPFCEKCDWKGSYCEMNRSDKRPFNMELADIFPASPLPLEAYKRYDQIKVKALPIPELDKIINVIGNKYSYPEKTVMFPLSGIKLNSKVQKDIHVKFHKDTTVGLMMSAKDIFLHNFIQANDFPETDKIVWAENLAKRNFDYVLSPNTSFYYNMPSCSQVFIRFLQYKAISELLDAGIPVIPSAQFIWESDIKRYGAWLNKMGFSHVYFNMQLATYDSQFKASLPSIKMLSDNVKAEIILLGVFNPERIKELEKIRKFIYVNSHLHILSTQRVVWHSPTKEVKEDIWNAMYYEDTMVKNIKNYRKYMSKILR